MNKRIDELAYQAEMQIRVSVSYSMGLKYFDVEIDDDEFRRVFAELIIRECAKVGNRAEHNDNDIRCIYDVITEHFGVK